MSLITELDTFKKLQFARGFAPAVKSFFVFFDVELPVEAVFGIIYLIVLGDADPGKTFGFGFFYQFVY